MAEHDVSKTLVQQSRLSEFERSAIKAMCEKVAQALTANYGNVKGGVCIVKGGKVLELQSEILIKQGERRGIQKGIQKGIDKKTIEVYKNCIANGMGKDAAVMISGITPELLELYKRTTT